MFLGAVTFWGLAVGSRLWLERREGDVVSVSSRTKLGGRWDPRGREALDALDRRRESDAFKARLRSGERQELPWPGLSAAQGSWAWLELLQGLHVESSYEGDFSWMFSKLDTILARSNPSEVDAIASLAPFYFVIGKDPVGATVVMNELVRRGTDRWRPWFWAGYHAKENLLHNRLAGDLLGKAALLKDSPDYTAALSLRLSRGEKFLDENERAQILRSQTDPVLLEKIRRARPEWFGGKPRF
jgi:hypothetical protein